MRVRKFLSFVSGGCLVLALATVGCNQVVEESRDRFEESRDRILGGDDPCYSQGDPRTGVLEASLVGVMTPGPAGNSLVVEIPETWEPNLWSQREADGHNKLTDYPVFSKRDNQIRVPAGEVALIWFEIEPPVITSAESPVPTEVRFVSKLSDRFQTAPRSKVDGNVVMLCDDNAGNTEDHAWEFGLKIDGEWYDPQIKNLGSGPPPISAN